MRIGPFQEGIWLAEMLAPGTAAYTGVSAGRIRAAIDVAALHTAWRGFARRHPLLRTTYHGDGSSVVVREHDVLEPAFEVVEVSSEEELHSSVFAGHDEPLDLGKGIARLRLYRRSPEDHVLVIDNHHIGFDLLATDIIHAELPLLYDAARRNEELRLPRLAATYAEFVEEQWARLGGSAAADAIAWWRKELEGVPGLLELPYDGVAPANRASRFASHSFSLGADLTRALRGYRQTTLFRTLLAGWFCLLRRHTSQDDLVVGVPVSCRPDRYADVVGNFINMVPVRVRVDETAPFRGLLGQLDVRVREVVARRDVPTVELLRHIRFPRDGRRPPLFQTTFLLGRTFRVKELAAICVSGAPWHARLGELPYESFGVRQFLEQTELGIALAEVDGVLYGEIKYSADLFHASTIERLAGRFQKLLEGVVRDPDTRIADLVLLSDAERTQLCALNDTRVHYEDPRKIHERLEDHAERSPGRTALVFDGKSMTYGELNARSNRLARHLQKLGAGGGALIGVCVERSFEMLVAVHGILKAGAAYVPIDPTYPPDRVAFMLSDAAPPIVLTQQHLLRHVPAGSTTTICLDSGWEAIARSPADSLATDIDDDSPAYVIYTSGSTGRPKGVVNTHAGIRNRLVWMQEAFSLGEQDHVLHKTPFSFDVSVWELFWPLMYGSRLVIAKPEGHRDPRYIADLIATEKVTILHFVPSMLRAFLEDGPHAPLRSLRRVVCSGEALPPDLARRFFETFPGVELENLYGPTEAAVDVTWWHCRPDDVENVIPIGRPIANCTVEVLDEALREKPIGVPGELFLGGIQVASGYLRRPELTRERFIERDGKRLYRTGDLGRIRATGEIEYLGRLDHQVKLRGFRIELGEIESVLLAHPRVGACVVVAREVRGDKQLVAYVAPAPVDVPELRAWVAARTPDYMVPSAFVVMAELPLSPSGKIDRGKLPAPEDGAERPPFAAPRTTVEKAVAAAMKEVLGVERELGLNDDFFALGGHSLLAVRLISRLEKEFGTRVSLHDFVHGPSCESLARAVLHAGGDGPLVHLGSSRSGAEPIVCLPPIGGEPYCFLELGRLWPSALDVVRPQGMAGEAPPLRSIHEMAALYVRAAPALRLLGYSFGGFVAYEMAQQLSVAGRAPEIVVIVDSDWSSLDGLDAKVSDEELRSLLHADEVGVANLAFVRSNVEAARSYVPQPYGGRLVFLRAADRGGGNDPAKRWLELTDGRAEIRDVPGDHFSVLRRPNVMTFAETLRQLLVG